MAVDARDSGDRKDLYDSGVRREVLDRIGRLAADSVPQWGQMTVGQMLAHVAEAQEVMNGKPLENTPWIVRLFGPLIRRAVVGPRPYGRSIRTHPQYLVTRDADFEIEKQRLVSALEAFTGTRGDAYEHAIFGPMIATERGRASYKHLDHHLRQFGV